MLEPQLTLTESTENGTTGKGDPLYSTRQVLNKKIGKMKIYLKNYILPKPDILLEKCHKELNIIDCFKYEGAISPKRK